MRKQLLHWLVFIMIFLFSFGTVQNPWSSRYLHDLKGSSASVMDQNDPLYHEIQAAAKKYDEKPVNARIDKVWKAIPGYDGIQVDMKASYEKMKKSGRFDQDKLVFREIDPTIHLKDLPPSPVYKGNPKKPMVSLMVNVAWGNKYIPTILKTLEAEHVHATFFLDGSWVKENPDLAKMIVEEGNEIGSHAYSHPNLKTMTTSQIRSELQKTNDVIRSTLEVTPKWFAPPSGSYNTQSVKIASVMGMRTILWTVDTVDWRNPNTSAMVQRVVGNVHAGSLILMHPTKPTAQGLKTIIQGIRERGYQIGSVSDVLSEDRL